MEINMTVHAGTKGKVVQVLGAVVDVEFPPDQLPEIYNQVLVRPYGAEKDLALEVEQHLGNNWVRCVAMGPTDGLQRGVEAIDTGQAITMPVGPKTLGRIFNVLGQAVENAPQRFGADRHGDGLTGVDGIYTTLKAIGGSHCHATYPVVAQMLL